MQSDVRCLTHGAMPPAFVCQHVAASVLTRQRVGFFWSVEDSSEFPDAWCSGCNERQIRCGHEWIGEALEQLEAKLMCSGCYLEARFINLGS